MEHVIRGASPASLAQVPALQAAITRADAIEQLREALTDDVMRKFLPLMNSALGFRCDRPNGKNKEPYSIDEVRTCAVEALLMGLRLTDNEWNIISGRCYVTREGFTRLLRECPGLTDLKISPGVPRGKTSEGVVIDYRCTWRIGEVEQSLDASVPVRGGEYATIDQLLGKGDRKIKSRIWAKITGSEVSADGDVEIETDHPTKPDDRLAKAKEDLEQLRREAAAKQPNAPKNPEAAPQPGAQETAKDVPDQNAKAAGVSDPPQEKVSGSADAQPPAGWESPKPPADAAKPAASSRPWVKK